MPSLVVLVDYDNVDAQLLRAGPISLAKTIVAVLPPESVTNSSGVAVRLYGGWRSHGRLTTTAQRIVPDLRIGSPTFVNVQAGSALIRVRLAVELADKPIATSHAFQETFVRERSLRRFRSRSQPWRDCALPESCGFIHLGNLDHSTYCENSDCELRLGEILVRDEQKMVDTLIVADIAHQAYVEMAKEIVVVSSDTDMWPGVLLALKAGCSVTHLHTKRGNTTQRHLLQTVPEQSLSRYREMSI